MGWTILNQGQSTNIHGLTLETSLSPTVDEIIFYDNSAAANRRATLDTLNLPGSALATVLDLSGKTLTLPAWVILATGGSTLASGSRTLANTTSAGFTLNLPSSPATGSWLYIADLLGTWSTHHLTVGRSSQLVAGEAADFVCNVSSKVLLFVFIGGTTGWQIYYS